MICLTISHERLWDVYSSTVCNMNLFRIEQLVTQIGLVPFGVLYARVVPTAQYSHSEISFVYFFSYNIYWYISLSRWQFARFFLPLVSIRGLLQFPDHLLDLLVRARAVIYLWHFTWPAVNECFILELIMSCLKAFWILVYTYLKFFETSLSFFSSQRDCE